MKYREKPVVVEAITFDEFIEYGKNHEANMVNGMPWSFEYNGHPVTHENDECYLIPTLEGTMRFAPREMLITGVNGEIYPCKKDIFEKKYEPVEKKSLFTVDVRITDLPEFKAILDYLAMILKDERIPEVFRAIYFEQITQALEKINNKK